MPNVVHVGCASAHVDRIEVQALRLGVLAEHSAHNGEVAQTGRVRGVVSSDGVGEGLTCQAVKVLGVVRPARALRVCARLSRTVAYAVLDVPSNTVTCRSASSGNGLARSWFPHGGVSWPAR